MGGHKEKRHEEPRHRRLRPRPADRFPRPARLAVARSPPRARRRPRRCGDAAPDAAVSSPPHARALRLLPEDLRHRPIRGAALPPLRPAGPPRRSERARADAAAPSGGPAPGCLVGRPAARSALRPGRALGGGRGRRALRAALVAGIPPDLRLHLEARLPPAGRVLPFGEDRHARVGGALRGHRHDGGELVPDPLRRDHGRRHPGHARGGAEAGAPGGPVPGHLDGAVDLRGHRGRDDGAARRRAVHLRGLDPPLGRPLPRVPARAGGGLSRLRGHPHGGGLRLRRAAHRSRAGARAREPGGGGLVRVRRRHRLPGGAADHQREGLDRAPPALPGRLRLLLRRRPGCSSPACPA